MSDRQKEQMMIPTGVIWRLHQVITQPVGVPTPISYSITIPAGERALLLGFRIGPDNYGAERGLAVRLFPTTAIGQTFSLAADAIDNAKMVGPPVLTAEAITQTTINVLGLPYMPFIMEGGSYILIEGNSLANTETLTGVFHIATRIKPPVTTVTGAGVTLTTDEIKQV